jgi:hypothetical protein
MTVVGVTTRGLGRLTVAVTLVVMVDPHQRTMITQTQKRNKLQVMCPNTSWKQQNLNFSLHFDVIKDHILAAELTLATDIQRHA